MNLKKYLKFLLIITFVFVAKVNAQVCGGSFGAPVFTETFGSVNNSFQTISPALVPPAFTTYNYKSTFPPSDGDYTISNTTEYLAWGWQRSLDHTNDALGTYGNMLVVNASFTPGEFYRRRVSNLCSNQVYRFSAWILNIHRSGNLIKPNVTFQIRSTSGAVLGSVSTGNLPEESTEFWKNFYLDFKSDPSSSDVDVVLINNAAGGNGNDLAIDDISFSPCGPATSITPTIGNIFTTGICDNRLGFQLTAQISAGTYSVPNYIWQKSTDGGISWVDLTAPTTNPNLNVSAGSYQNNDQFRFIVGESTNINLTTCRVISPVSIVKINGYPTAPNSQIFNFCQNSTGNSISINGNNLLWYSSSTGGIGNAQTPTINTSTVTTYDYWVSQTVNGCESARTKITVNILPNPNAPFVSDFQICQNATAQSLSANGTQLLWYTSSSGGTGSSVAPIPNTSQTGVFSYWVSQTVNGCESARAEIKVSVLANPNIPVVSNLQYCQNTSATALTALGNNLLWYTSATGGTGSSTTPIPNTSIAGDFSFWVSQTVNGCESARAEIKVSVLANPTIPIVSDFQICQNATAQSLSANGNQLLWYTSSSGGTGSSVAPIPNTLQTGVFSYWVSQTVNGCESARAEIKVSVLANPTIPIVSDFQICQNATATALTAVGNNLLWYTTSSGGTGSSVAPIPNTLQTGDFSFWVSQTINGCESARAEIKVSVLPSPKSDDLKDTSICDGEKITLDVGSGFNAEWQTSPPIISQTLEVSTPGQYSVKLFNSNGCSSIQTVNVTPGITPIITQIKSGENFLEIIAKEGNPPYLYSLDNVNWQTSNIFSNLKAGIYEVYVKSKINSCTAIAKSAVLFIPNAFTPNFDGVNDVWRVGNIEFFSKAKLKIFDRYGNMVFIAEDISKFNWDGFHNRRALATGVYWYVIEIENNSTRTGWVLLKNRK